jgi:tetratricopeptide (TPR) repeat protein
VKRYGEMHVDVAESHADLSRAYRRAGRLDDAERQIRAALAIDAAVLPPEHWRHSNHLNALMMVELQKRDYGAALATATESLRIDRIVYADGDHPEVANDLNSVGMLHAQLEDWPAAVAPLREALDRSVAKFGAESFDAAVTRSNYGVVLAHAGDVAGGEAELEHAIATLEAAKDPDLDEEAATWEKLARVRLDRDDAAGALTAIDRIDALLAKMDPPGAYWDGRAGALRASALIELGRAAEARPVLDKASAELARSKNPDAVLRVEVPLLDANARLALGERDTARERVAREALAGLANPPKRLAALANRLEGTE